MPFMLSTRRALLAQAAALTAPPLLAQPRELLMVNTVYPPFVCPPKHPLGAGLDVDLARDALRRCGLGMRLELLPWKRVLVTLEAGKADLTTTISRQPERDAYLRWSQPYRLGAAYTFYLRSGDGRSIRSLSDVAGLRLGTVIGFRYPPAIVELGGVRLEPARDLATLVTLLEAGRIDAIVVTAIAGAWEVRERGFAERLQRQAFEYASDSPNYFGFAKSRVDEALVEQVNAALAAMQREGVMAKLEARYLG
jgi:polar amino acid transport system substrate-binding protein